MSPIVVTIMYATDLKCYFLILIGQKNVNSRFIPPTVIQMYTNTG